MNFSHYQTDIFNWLENGEGNAIIEGVAGCGKTTTIVQAAKNIPADRKVLIMVFNRHIRIPLQEKLSEHKNIEVHTFNSFGWKICRDNAYGVKLCDGRIVRNKDQEFLCESIDLDKDSARYHRVRGPLFALIGLLKANCCVNADSWQQLAFDYGVDLDLLKPSDKFGDVLAEVYQKSIHNIDRMTYDDQIFQPILRDWAIPQFDIVMVDESQDCSPCNIEMIKRVGGRSVLIGDPDQSIYLFRGAHPDAMRDTAIELEAITLPLSVCYRCPDAVIRSAQVEVPRIEAPVPNPKGEGIVETVDTPTFELSVQPGDMVLCRNTHPLIKRCLRQWALGKPAFVKGRDLSKQLIDLIDKVHASPSSLKSQYRSIPEREIMAYAWNLKREPEMAKVPCPKYAPPDLELFLKSLEIHISNEQGKLIQRGLEELADQLEDRKLGIISLADGCTHVVQIILKIESMFSDDEDPERSVVFMTGHKCKGLEFDNVWMLRPDLCPSKRAKTEAAQRQERNLMYVMKTRAMSALRFVTPEAEELF